MDGREELKEGGRFKWPSLSNKLMLRFKHDFH